MNKRPLCPQVDIHRYEEPEGDQEGPLCRELNCKQEELARRIGVPPPQEDLHQAVNVCGDPRVEEV